MRRWRIWPHRTVRLCAALLATMIVSSAPLFAAEIGDYKFSLKRSDHNSDAGHWMLMNGRALSTTAEPTLFDLLGYQFGGSGDTFHLPDTRGRTLVFENNPHITGGSDGTLSTRAAGDMFGAETVPLAVDNLPPHTHGAGSYAAPANGTMEVLTGRQGENIEDHGGTASFLLHRSGTVAGKRWRSNVIRSPSGGGTVSGTSDTAGAGTPMDVAQPSLVLGNAFVLVDTRPR